MRRGLRDPFMEEVNTMAKIDKGKFPLIGIAKFLEDETEDPEKGRRMAKAVLTRTVEKSETATTEDKEEAKAELGELEGRMRVASSGRLSSAIAMKNPNDLKILKGLERMYIALPDFNLMKENIKDHGVQVPIIITEDNEIIDGRNRWIAAKELGIQEVPTIYNTETRLPEIVRLMLSYNVCRRQLTQEEKTHYVKFLRELGKSKKGPGRPCNNPKELSLKTQLKPSTREIAKELNVSQSTVQRAINPPIRREWDEEKKSFSITIGKSKEADKKYIIGIYRYIDAMVENMQLGVGDKVEFIIVSRISKAAD